MRGPERNPAPATRREEEEALALESTTGGVTLDRPIWRDRRGPLGSIEEQEYCNQRLIPYVDPVSAIRGVLRAVRYNEPVKIVTKEYDATGGFKLTDRMVSRLEVLNAVGRLPFPLKEAVELTALQGLTRQQACEVLNMSDPTFGKHLAAAYVAIVRMVFDYDAVPPSE